MSVAARKLAKEKAEEKHFGGPRTLIRLTAPERDTILAALRHWQNRTCPLSQRTQMRDIELIATNGAEHPALTTEEINALCADLNV
jgi:hypothetical protein